MLRVTLNRASYKWRLEIENTLIKQNKPKIKKQQLQQQDFCQ